MSNKLAVLNDLPVNKTVVFYSPIEGKDVLVRTGTITGGLSFFHSLLHAYSKDYISMNTTDRIKFAKKLRISIMSKLDKERWEKNSNGLIAKIPFQENVNTLLSDFYRFISRGKTGRTKNVREVIRKVIKNEKIDIEAYKLITEMIKLDDFENHILPSAYEKCSKSFLNKCKKTIISYGVEYYTKEFDKLKDQLDDSNIKFYIRKLEKLLHEIVEQADKSAYSDYSQNMYNSSMEVDSSTIKLISEKFNRGVYFLDSRTRMPYMVDNSNENIKKRKFIIVMCTGECHYEVVGRLLPGNNIQREFNYNDSLIKRIHTYLYKPRKIPDEYPNLIPYLPKNLRNKLGFEISDSEEHRSSPSDSEKHRSSPSDSEEHRSSPSDSERHSEDNKYISSEEIEKSSEYEKSGSDEELDSLGINQISRKITMNK